MKKNVIFVFAVLSIFLLAACHPHLRNPGQNQHWHPEKPKKMKRKR